MKTRPGEHACEQRAGSDSRKPHRGASDTTWHLDILQMRKLALRG